MTIYVFDSSALINLFTHYYPKRFPSLWVKFDQLMAEGRITSTRELLKELDTKKKDELGQWAIQHSDLFVTPNSEELAFVREILKVSHFRQLIAYKNWSLSKPCADPFLIARTRCLEPDGCLVTSEQAKPNAAKIPNVCAHFKIPCMDLEEFMESEGWTF